MQNHLKCGMRNGECGIMGTEMGNAEWGMGNHGKTDAESCSCCNRSSSTLSSIYLPPVSNPEHDDLLPFQIEHDPIVANAKAKGAK